MRRREADLLDAWIESRKPRPIDGWSTRSIPVEGGTLSAIGFLDTVDGFLVFWAVSPSLGVFEVARVKWGTRPLPADLAPLAIRLAGGSPAVDWAAFARTFPEAVWPAEEE